MTANSTFITTSHPSLKRKQETPTFARKFSSSTSEASVKNDQTSLGQGKNASYRTNSKTLKKIQPSALYKCEMKTTIKIQLEADEIGKKRLLDTMEVFLTKHVMK
jgi:hypothetical protein